MLPSLVVRNDLQCYMYELHDEREVENFDEGVTRERGKIIPKDKMDEIFQNSSKKEEEYHIKAINLYLEELQLRPN